MRVASQVVFAWLARLIPIGHKSRSLSQFAMREFNATLDHSVGVKLTMCRLLYTAIITLAACAYQHPALNRGSDYQVSAEASTARGGIDSARQLALSDA